MTEDSGTQPQTTADEPVDVLDDPLRFLEQFARYLRDRSSRAELLMAARWAATLVEAVELGAWRHGLPYPVPLAAFTRSLSAWARNAEEDLPCAGRPAGGSARAEGEQGG